MPNINVRLAENEHEDLVKACSGRRCSLSDLTRAALKSYLSTMTEQRADSPNDHQLQRSDDPNWPALGRSSRLDSGLGYREEQKPAVHRDSRPVALARNVKFYDSAKLPPTMINVTSHRATVTKFRIFHDDGTIDYYENGKLKQKNVPKPGGSYVAHVYS